MNWKKLKDNKCPECATRLLSKNGSHYGCVNCGFSISHTRFDMLVNELYKNNTKPYQFQGDNAEELNNLGHELVSEGFEDYKEDWSRG